MRRALPFILLIAFFAFIIIVIQLYAPKRINWYETFEKKDKNPYGDYLVYSFLKDIFPGKNIETKERTPYEVLDYYDYSQQYSYSSDTIVLNQTEQQDATENFSDSIQALPDTPDIQIADSTATNTQPEPQEEELENSKIIPDVKNYYDTSSSLRNYIFINSGFSPGETDVKALLQFVSEGNAVFIAAEEMRGLLADTLNLQVNIGYYEKDFSSEDLQSNVKKDSIYLTLLNPRLKTYEKKYWYRDGTVTGYFSSVDTANTVILGKNSEGNACYIQVRYGDGYFYISSTPVAFTNYNMVLAHNADFIAASLSYLPVRETYWDEYYKNFRKDDSNSLRFIESQPPLNWAYYLALWSAIVYIVFESKRIQRVIPVVEPPKNTTVEFVSTIGRLYFQNGNHKDIASKKIYYFLEYIRTNFYVGSTDFDKEFIEKIVQRSGIERTEVVQLFTLIQHIQKAGSISQSELLELNKRIEAFKFKNLQGF